MRGQGFPMITYVVSFLSCFILTANNYLLFPFVFLVCFFVCMFCVYQKLKALPVHIKAHMSFNQMTMNQQRWAELQLKDCFVLSLLNQLLHSSIPVNICESHFSLKFLYLQIPHLFIIVRKILWISRLDSNSQLFPTINKMETSRWQKTRKSSILFTDGQVCVLLLVPAYLLSFVSYSI